jgi:hypothetical protein
MKIIHLSGILNQQARSQAIEQFIENCRNFVAVVNATDQALLEIDRTKPALRRLPENESELAQYG